MGDGWRDQLWAELIAEYQTGGSWVLSPEEEEHLILTQFGVSSPDLWEESILHYMADHEGATMNEICRSYSFQTSFQGLALMSESSARRSSKIFGSLIIFPSVPSPRSMPARRPSARAETFCS